jgi:hypothetical protein
MSLPQCFVRPLTEINPNKNFSNLAHVPPVSEPYPWISIVQNSISR